MRFGVLGPLAVWTADGQPVRIPELKVRTLLADLLSYAGRPVTYDRLIEDLWGERPPRNPVGALQTRVSQLRRALDEAEPGGRGLVVSQPPGYLLRLDSATVDADRFQALTAQARATADLRVRANLLADALALWRGPAYADFADEAFIRSVAVRLEEERLVALEDYAQVRLELGEHNQLAGELGDLVTHHPLRERLRAIHLRALYRAGRQSEALAGYAELRTRLADELGVDPSPDLVALYEAILKQDPALDAAVPPATNLPTALTDLVGRAEAVTRLRGLVQAARLLTLTGPAGVGKTRLAVEIARDAGGAFPDGTWLVELAGLSRASGGSSSAVAEVVASVLDIRDDVTMGRPGDPLDQLADAMRLKNLLLVLDNCEHVVESAAALAETLLRAAPRLHILATSREPLAISGERLWPVPPLDLPDPATPVAELGRFSAVELFVTRAAAAAAGFGLRPDNAPAVIEICRRLDGIPLALELAATRVRSLGVYELAARLGDRFRVLAAGTRGAPPRHQTLRAMIDWSWELLSEPERLVLRRLGVHADGCTLRAAEQVGADEGLDVVDVMTRLVDRSLVIMTDGPDGPRYWLLESVRDYCVARLEEAGEYDEIRRRHVRYYTDFAVRAEPNLYGHGQRGWLERIDREWANLRTALETAVRLADGHHAARLVNALTWYWLLRGRLTEARRSLDLVLGIVSDAAAATWRAGIALLVSDGADAAARADTTAYERIAEPGPRARAQWFLAYAQRGFADLTGTADLLGQALETFRNLDDRWGIAAALSVRATIGRAQGRLVDAHRDALDSNALFEELGDGWGQVKATNTLAELAEIAGDYEQAARLHRDGLRMAEELSLWDEASLRLSGQGRIALLSGDFAAADRLHEQAMRMAAGQSNRVAEHFAEMGLALSARRQGRLEKVESHLTKWVNWLRGVDGEPGLALVLAELGFAAEQRGDAAAALRLHRDGLASARKIGDPRAVARAFEGLAGAHSLAGDAVVAARLLGAATTLRESVGAPLPAAERGDVDRITAALRATLGEKVFAAEFDRGTQTDPE